MIWCNCLVWALLVYRKRHVEWTEAGGIGGTEPALRFRRSRLEPRWMLHAQVEVYEGGRWVIEQFVPLDKRPLRWWQLWRALWCRGTIQRGDEPHMED